ncbi:MAG: DedA family protein [Micrococcales bacterium]|nr:DedA family protein [Micrococcales bacterium]
MNEILTWLLALVQSVDPWLRILLSGVAMFGETSVLLGVLIPGDTVVLVSSTATADWWQYGFLVLAVILGSLGGETFGFYLGRYFGPRIRHSRLGRRIGEHNWDRAERYLERRGGIAVFVSRFLPVMRSLIPLTVGTSEMRYRRFLAWTTPACTIWAVAYVLAGWLAADSYRRLAGQLRWAGFVFAAIVLVFVMLVWLVKKAITRVEERHMEHSASVSPEVTDDLRADHRRTPGGRAPGALGDEAPPTS